MGKNFRINVSVGTPLKRPIRLLHILQPAIRVGVSVILQPNVPNGVFSLRSTRLEMSSQIITMRFELELIMISSENKILWRFASGRRRSSLKEQSVNSALRKYCGRNVIIEYFRDFSLLHFKEAVVKRSQKYISPPPELMMLPMKTLPSPGLNVPLKWFTC